MKIESQIHLNLYDTVNPKFGKRYSFYYQMLFKNQPCRFHSVNLQIACCPNLSVVKLLFPVLIYRCSWLRCVLYLVDVLTRYV